MSVNPEANRIRSSRLTSQRSLRILVRHSRKRQGRGIGVGAWPGSSRESLWSSRCWLRRSWRIGGRRRSTRSSAAWRRWARGGPTGRSWRRSAGGWAGSPACSVPSRRSSKRGWRGSSRTGSSFARCSAAWPRGSSRSTPDAGSSSPTPAPPSSSDSTPARSAGSSPS